MAIVYAKAIQTLESRLQTAMLLFRNPRPLLKTWGVVLRKDVAETFHAGGRPRWKPLATSTTIARRRSGGDKWFKSGRSGGSYMSIKTANPLKNDHHLEKSFDVRVHPQKVVLFSDSPVAIFHEYGTRRGYPITPKRAKWLAIPMGPKTLAGLGRNSTPTATGGFIFRPTPGQKRIPKRLRGREGKAVRPYSSIMFTKRVWHPGVVARPMLPDAERIVPDLKRAADDLIRKTMKKRGIIAIA